MTATVPAVTVSERFADADKSMPPFAPEELYLIGYGHGPMVRLGIDSMNLPARITDWLNVVTLVVAIVSMVLSSMALWPQWKSSLAKLRDGILWFALIFVIVAIATVGWTRFSQRRGGVPPATYPSSLDPGADVDAEAVR